MTTSAGFFVSYVRNYLLCCIFPDKTYDPSQFQANHIRYRACFGALHVETIAPALVSLRTVLFLLVVIFIVATSDSAILGLCSVFSFFVVTASTLLFLGGMHYKRNNLILSYFFVSVLFVIYLLLQLFINFLDSATTKNTLHQGPILQNALLFAILCFEMYTGLVVWRVFVYICDYRMDLEVKDLERAKKIAERYTRSDPLEIPRSTNILLGEET
ncbi:hypothetical protein Q1695_007571 [Nippostrongylus brasiliensis]|nr:hypothetical protein Q1695_007571 [Nippostrongylus brasiliensis]